MHNLYINNTQQKKLFFNNTKIQRAYYNNVLVFEAVIRVPYPTITSNPTYTGSAVSPTLGNYNSAYYTVTGNRATNAGTYTMTFKLKDGYGWDIADESKMYSNYTLNQTINRAKINKPTITSNNLIYNGGTFYVVNILNGFDSSKMDLHGTISATDAGNYTSTVTPRSNYCQTDNSTGAISLSWRINKKSFDKPYLSGPDREFAFDGSDKSWAAINYDSYYMNQNGSTEFNASTYDGNEHTEYISWSLKDTHNCQQTDGSTDTVTDQWKVIWINGQSHFGNDIYNKGWCRGVVTFGYVRDWPDGASYIDENGIMVFISSDQSNDSSNGRTATATFSNIDISTRINHVYLLCRRCDITSEIYNNYLGIDYNSGAEYVQSERVDLGSGYDGTPIERVLALRDQTVSRVGANKLQVSQYNRNNNGSGEQSDLYVERIWYD